MSILDRIRQPKVVLLGIVILTLIMGIAIGTMANTGVRAARTQSAAPDATPLVTPNPAAIGNEFTKLAKMLEPSVVNISTDYTPKPTSATNRRRGQQPQGQDDDENSEDSMDLFRRLTKEASAGTSTTFMPVKNAAFVALV